VPATVRPRQSITASQCDRHRSVLRLGSGRAFHAANRWYSALHTRISMSHSKAACCDRRVGVAAGPLFTNRLRLGSMRLAPGAGRRPTSGLCTAASSVRTARRPASRRRTAAPGYCSISDLARRRRREITGRIGPPGDLPDRHGAARSDAHILADQEPEANPTRRAPASRSAGDVAGRKPHADILYRPERRRRPIEGAGESLSGYSSASPVMANSRRRATETVWSANRS
jgi:hypothetical protein